MLGHILGRGGNGIRPKLEVHQGDEGRFRGRILNGVSGVSRAIRAAAGIVHIGHRKIIKRVRVHRRGNRVRRVGRRRRNARCHTDPRRPRCGDGATRNAPHRVCIHLVEGEPDTHRHRHCTFTGGGHPNGRARRERRYRTCIRAADIDRPGLDVGGAAGDLCGGTGLNAIATCRDPGTDRHSRLG